MVVEEEEKRATAQRFQPSAKRVNYMPKAVLPKRTAHKRNTLAANTGPVLLQHTTRLVLTFVTSIMTVRKTLPRRYFNTEFASGNNGTGDPNLK